jgi:hypothetical protein
MATIWKNRLDGSQEHTRDLFGRSVETCSFCGENSATSFWHGRGRLTSCCQGCATNVLPALAADALVGEQRAHPNLAAQLRQLWLQSSRVFWEAAALAMCRGAERR